MKTQRNSVMGQENKAKKNRKTFLNRLLSLILLILNCTKYEYIKS